MHKQSERLQENKEITGTVSCRSVPLWCRLLLTGVIILLYGSESFFGNRIQNAGLLLFEALEKTVLLTVLLTAAVEDFRTGTVQKPVWLFSAAFSLAVCFLRSDRWFFLAEAAAGGILLPGILLLISLAADRITGKTTLGGADLWLISACGFSFGMKRTFLQMILLCITAVLYGILFRKRNRRFFPLGPSIFASAFLSVILFIGN